jgi:hypothetical protein
VGRQLSVYDVVGEVKPINGTDALWKKWGAPGEDRTRDLSLTKRTHYHYATEALLTLVR